jgi:hypothetical protein
MRSQAGIFYSGRGVVLRTSLAVVPEPATWSLALLGSLTLAVIAPRRART